MTARADTGHGPAEALERIASGGAGDPRSCARARSSRRGPCAWRAAHPVLADLAPDWRARRPTRRRARGLLWPRSAGDRGGPHVTAQGVHAHYVSRRALLEVAEPGVSVKRLSLLAAVRVRAGRFLRTSSRSPRSPRSPRASPDWRRGCPRLRGIAWRCRRRRSPSQCLESGSSSG